MIADRESRVRQRAYEIWQREGCPEGQAELHWHLAAQEVEVEDTAPAESEMTAAGSAESAAAAEPAEPVVAPEPAEPVKKAAAKPKRGTKAKAETDEGAEKKPAAKPRRSTKAKAAV